MLSSQRLLQQKEPQIGEKKGMRIVLFPLPFQGHISPMLQLAQILYSKGFSIAIIQTDFNSLDPSNYPHFSFHSIPVGLPDAQMRTEDVVQLILWMNGSCVEGFGDCLGELAAAAGEEPVGCVITDAHWHFAQGVADGLGIRRITLRTGNVGATMAMVGLPLLRWNGLLPPQEEKWEDPVPGFSPLKFKDLPLIQTHHPEALYLQFSSMLHQTKASSALIFNSFEELEPDLLISCTHLFSIPIFPLGPFHKHFPGTSTTSLLTQDHASIPWLNSKPPNSVLYVSFGSIAAVTASEFLEIASALANCSLPFLWVVRPGMVSGSEWLEPLPEGFAETVGERGLIVKWAPQREVLAHTAVGGFWTHGGWNSTLESICEGVPMLCYPYFGDQMANSRYVSDVWRIGVRLERMERGEIEKAIRELMEERERGGMRERLEDLKKKAEGCLREEGSSVKSLERLVNHILAP